MCTALSFQTKDHYFGRNLDLEFSFGEGVTVCPRHFTLGYRRKPANQAHYAIIGMATIAQGYPLFYDATNEKGLSMAGLNFPKNAVYHKPQDGKDNIASFECIPWILSQCSNVEEAEMLCRKLNITDDLFSDAFPQSTLHWLIADEKRAITIESMEDGLHIYDNPVGILTNNPPFPTQLFQLNNYRHLSVRTPENSFSDKIELDDYSRGMGGIGLPGDLSSASRFVRACFAKMNSLCGKGESESVAQFFHILGMVAQQKGLCFVEHSGMYEFTIYSSCVNTSKGIYYYKTYENGCISAVDMHKENLDGESLVQYPLLTEQRIDWQNG